MHDKSQNQRIQELAEKWTNGTINETEKQEFIDWYNQFNDEELVLPPIEGQTVEGLKQEMFAAVQQGMQMERKPLFFLWKRVAAAAAILLLLATGSYFIFFDKKNNIESELVLNDPALNNDIKAPGSTRATLQLANGNIVYLDNTASGSLAEQGAVTVEKLPDGQIVYTGADQELRYNTISNPKGSKPVSLQLSDGTMVWLNAASSLRYPASFVGNSRKVEITGEAYFEVAHDAAKPFYVQKGRMEVQVLGTHFNVNAYDDENNIKITLLEGSVKVTNNDHAALIKPGQQASVNGDDAPKTANVADMEQVMAWKNGLFKFNDEDLQSIMKQIERWYNVEVVYEGNLRPINFGGVISRKENASAVLDLLALTGVVKFKIENGNGKAGRITVIL